MEPSPILLRRDLLLRLAGWSGAALASAGLDMGCLSRSAPPSPKPAPYLDYGNYADYFDYANYANYGDYANAGYADYSDYADYANYGDYVNYADAYGDAYADYSNYANYADYSDYADGGGYSDYADYADAYADYGDAYFDYADYGDAYSDYGDAYGDAFTAAKAVAPPTPKAVPGRSRGSRPEFKGGRPERLGGQAGPRAAAWREAPDQRLDAGGGPGPGTPSAAAAVPPGVARQGRPEELNRPERQRQGRRSRTLAKGRRACAKAPRKGPEGEGR